MSNKNKPEIVQENMTEEIVEPVVEPVEEENFLGAIDGVAANLSVPLDKSVPMVTYLASYKLPLGATRVNGKPYQTVYALAKLAGVEAIKALARDDYQQYNKLVRPVLSQIAIGITITKTIKLVKV